MAPATENQDQASREQTVLREGIAEARRQFDRLLPATDAAASARLRVARAPGRVNLIGEHVDYNDGFVLPMAIDHHVLVLARPRRDSTVRLASTAFEGQVVEFDIARPIGRAEPQWGNYARGMAAGLINAGIPLSGCDLLIANTLPVGGGLSSSAAILIGIGSALLAVGGHRVDPDRLALIAKEAEHAYAGVPCGIMDQTAVAGSRAGHAMLLDCRERTRHFVPIDPKELRVVIANTMIHHELADGEYERRVRSCQAAVDHFRAADPSVRTLRDVPLEQVARAQGALDPVTFRRARHVVSEIARARSAAELLGKRRYEEVGELMAQSHRSLRDDYEVSCPELDFLAERAASQKGVYGARMTGAGFGGCVVALVQPRACDAVIADLQGAYRQQFGITPTVFATGAAAGASILE